MARIRPARKAGNDSQVLTQEFKDHFSAASDAYAKHRPRYPDSLFEFLASLAPEQGSAWDCATGNGQAAIALSEYFPTVVATDASQSQIDAAIPHTAVDYRVALAESSRLPDACMDLITVGQALHWFDQDAFLAEASRVLKPGGVLAVWCYELCAVNPDCDAIVAELYEGIVGNYWPPERVMIEQGYDHIVLPGEKISVPTFEMSLDWRADDMLGYLGTWSACKRYAAENGSDPVVQIAARLQAVWGPESRKVVWPLKIKVNRIKALLE